MILFNSRGFAETGGAVLVLLGVGEATLQPTQILCHVSSRAQGH